MRIIIAALVLFAFSNLSHAECTNEMEAFNNHQNVIKGMMDMNFQGKLNSENANQIGERLKKGQEAADNGDYAKACEIYDSIIEDYGFEKVFGAHSEGSQESKPEEKASQATSSESSAATPAEEDAEVSPSSQ